MSEEELEHVEFDLEGDEEIDESEGDVSRFSILGRDRWGRRSDVLAAGSIESAREETEQFEDDYRA